MVYWKIDSYLTVGVLENRLFFNSTCTNKYPLPKEIILIMIDLSLIHFRIARKLQKTQALRQYLQSMSSKKERDNLIYQETRKLVAATFQAITYQEYLPLVLGPQLMREYGLVTEPGQESHYNSKLDPTIWNEFATFAYR